MDDRWGEAEGDADVAKLLVKQEVEGEADGVKLLVREKVEGEADEEGERWEVRGEVKRFGGSGERIREWKTMVLPARKQDEGDEDEEGGDEEEVAAAPRKVSVAEAVCLHDENELGEIDEERTNIPNPFSLACQSGERVKRL